MVASDIGHLVNRIGWNPSETDRRCAVISLGYRAELIEEADRALVEAIAVPKLANLLSHYDDNIRSDAIHALRSISEAGVSVEAALPEIAAATGNSVIYVRMVSVRILSPMCGSRKEFDPAIVNALQDESGLVSNAALEALGGFVPSCCDRKRLESMRAGLAEARKSDYVKKARTMLAIRISELEYPTLGTGRRWKEQAKNLGRRMKLSMAF